MSELTESRVRVLQGGDHHVQSTLAAFMTVVLGLHGDGHASIPPITVFSSSPSLLGEKLSQQFILFIQLM
jgi:hypothetical protein